MNISKNILSLGLIAVISGVSTAQTYTGTAGTNGVTDIQSDYSQATGDGASVSVDVPLEFELPKKVMLSVYDATGIAANPEFNPVRDALAPWGYSVSGTLASGFIERAYIPEAGIKTSSAVLVANGAFYTNADNINFEFVPPVSFIHEAGVDSGELIPYSWLHVGNGLTSTGYNTLSGSQFLGIDSYNLAIDYNSLISSSGAGWYLTRFTIREDSLDPTDRAGKYLGVATTTITVL